ncbi:hypothetical protein [Gilliamella apicola]|uniref:hypothetical protein n=1 Tax=Gilliamella apicola TaxID=1196095 RepID=UPI000A340746|nr:hypothetical protein [Gilliamella apicola]OTP93208.1 hypothetical protein B6D13_10735 [Gilliamella apicola]OTQ00180.1 hypothetical protein B6D07_10700 [Gilliamella apicola]OTQ31695.1 hypothetical protein B6D02_03540 [Gilliamella apicola]
MKIKLLKPLYLDSVVVMDGTITERDESHARELIARGYAELMDEGNTPDSTPEDEGNTPDSTPEDEGNTPDSDNGTSSNEDTPETKGKKSKS